jgi:hypothetical protein
VVVPETFLDLEDIFVNEIAGSPTLFLILGFVVLVFFAARFRFPNPVTILMMVLFALVMSPFAGFMIVLPITLFVVGVFIAWNYTRMLKQN